MTASLRRAAGNAMIVGLSGTELTALERAWLKLVEPSGVILFRRNIEDAAQCRSLLDEATALCAADGFRCVDVEGGTVDRLRDALAALPSARAVAAASHCSGNSNLPEEHGDLVARAIRSFGFNTTLAPVLDLALPASASVMGSRAADATGAGVVAYARGFLKGLAAHRVMGCGKHFPGLGGGTLDSHLTTPSIDRTMRQMMREDLLPYRELRDLLPMVMVNHAEYSVTQARNRPASVSSFWITTVLRKRLGYSGIVLSDDLEMGGVLQCMPIEEAAVEAIRAGTDLIEICHSAELILRAYEALVSEAERSTAFAKLLLAHAARMRSTRRRWFAHRAVKALTARQLEALRGKMLRFGKTIAEAQSA